MHGKLSQLLNEAEVRDIAMRYLGRREYGLEELKRKLVQRGAESGMAEKIVAELAQQDLASDERFTDMYVRTRARRMFGPLKIHAELRQRGVADGPISAALPDDEETWFESATQWTQKHSRGSLDYAARARLYRSLLNRGFTHEQANVALDRCASGHLD